jgi:hypothetical protein
VACLKELTQDIVEWLVERRKASEQWLTGRDIPTATVESSYVPFTLTALVFRLFLKCFVSDVFLSHLREEYESWNPDDARLGYVAV